MSTDRHQKWQKVEPGYLVPAGQPHRKEYTVSDLKDHALEEVFKSEFAIPFNDNEEWFIDSTWYPPAKLPNEPTWGLVIAKDVYGPLFGCWSMWQSIGEFRCMAHRVDPKDVIDFIPLNIPDDVAQRIDRSHE